MVGPRDDVEELDADLDGPEPPAAAPSAAARRAAGPGAARRRRRRLLVVAGLVVVLVVAGLVRQAVVRDAQGPPLDGSASATELFPALREGGAAGAGDGFPAQQAADGLGVVPGTAHLLTATTDLLFWVAQDDDGEVCLVVRTAGEPVRLGGNCAPPDEAASRGVSLPSGNGVVATLVPEGFDTAPLVRQGYVRLAAGLWVGEETAQQVASDAVGSVTARPVVPTQSQTGSGRLPVFLTRDATTYAVVLACVGVPDAGGLAADPTAALAVDGQEQRLGCSSVPSFRRFTGDGGPVRVDVGVPGGVRWAARVVECEGSLRGPVCDRGGF
ncbi:hypothetical protein FHN55_02375 [Streptomyces sp. NP160]|uniref:hypothetical protein n=1 Tax=Streptomyces sp. NP160 TaxID=2586637 RepID=UPI00111B18A7|nr:hypothetical protein [Streptomyces sp. NP160]TNM69625.1 hypothetical protein FHN55_02375 [Streptomyces sp. NP160]